MGAKKIVPVKLPPLHFDARTQNYWLRLPDGRFLCLDSRSVKMHFKKAGLVLDTELNDAGLQVWENEMLKAQLTNYVDYAGPLAGWSAGLHIMGDGKRVLVTSEAHPVQPKRGKVERLEKFLTELLGQQFRVVLYWLKIAWEAANARKFRPGQLLALCGPAQCGKSFLQFAVTKLLGGRSAKPYRYMTGQTHFNSDLAGAETLLIEDENAKMNLSARREFGTAIKNWTVDEYISVHAKGREAITLPFFRRLTLSVNNEPENMAILPPMDGSLLDKVTLLHCAPAKLHPERSKNVAMLEEELPALVYMLTKIGIPIELRDDRFGVRSYQNPELMELLGNLAPETRLETLIEQIVFADTDEFHGTASELEQLLHASPFQFQVTRLLSFDSAMGTYLARLASKHPDRYEKHKSKGQTKWLIRKETNGEK